MIRSYFHVPDRVAAVGRVTRESTQMAGEIAHVSGSGRGGYRSPPVSALAGLPGRPRAGIFVFGLGRGARGPTPPGSRGRLGAWIPAGRLRCVRLGSATPTGDSAKRVYQQVVPHLTGCKQGFYACRTPSHRLQTRFLDSEKARGPSPGGARGLRRSYCARFLRAWGQYPSK